MDLVFCVDYTIIGVDVYLQRIAKYAYGFILSTKGDLYFHPFDAQNAEVLTPEELEIPDTYSNYKSERKEFNEEIIPLFSTNRTSLKTYKKDGDDNIIAVSPIYVRLSRERTLKHIYSIGIVTVEDYIYSDIT